ncbi:holo-ACP synthase CitX [Floricoccus penangensis]|uniref:citrate lyase holo-[acyl-carrier protein] synthase n=1 Tax=Floricoccus penangensis TaxID=1859475 RepID=A0A9Q5JFR2_9LACT|nr:citrate lyase holo-[acyl-carrier protein] synthase [Floricoccus penangensis]OFI46483.1 holo-ACP synthase CitX [Floricoccus penangensis]
MSNLFSGKPVSLIEMLDAREKRSYKQKDLLCKYPNLVMVSMTMNIPGEIKNSEQLSDIFDSMLGRVKELLVPDVIVVNDANIKTGREAFLLINGDAKDIKRELVKLEEESPLNRLFDLDVVLIDEDGLIYQVSRDDLKLPKRLCLICGKNAKECSRSRKHSVKELQEEIERLVINE